MYKVRSFPGDFELWVHAEGYAPYMEKITLNQAMVDFNITMDPNATLITGLFQIVSDPPVDGHYYLINLDNDEIIYGTFGPPVLSIPNLYYGEYSLIIDAEGFQPYYHPETIDISKTNYTYKVTLPGNKLVLKETNDEKIISTLKFRDDDWNKLQIKETWTLNHDSELFGLELVDYGDPVTIADPRFQVDYESAFEGNQDGIPNDALIEGEEYSAFIDWLEDRGPYQMFTNGYFDVNNTENVYTHYSWLKNSVSVTTEGFNGKTYKSTDTMKIITTTNYDHLPAAEPLDNTHYKIRFRNLRENEVIKFNLPAGYEIQDPEAYDNSTVWIIDSDTCQINDSVTIFAVMHEDPTAKFEVSDDYTKSKVDIEFDAMGSLPGSGMITNYTWDFADGEMGYGSVVEHNYTKSGVFNVTLTVMTTAGLNDIAWKEVTIDNTKPVVVIEFQNETGVKITDGWENTETEEFIITFNGSKTKDTIDGVLAGKIDRYVWDFGDNTGQAPTNEVTEKSFDDPETYTVTLNVTDKAGNYAFKEVDIRIKDREAPTPNMYTDPAGRTCPINETIQIIGNANDNLDDADNITYVWDLDATVDKDLDGNLRNDNDATGKEITFTPTKPGPVTITQWVTDRSGNEDNSTNLQPPEWTIDVTGVDLLLDLVEEESDKFIDVDKSKPKVDDDVKIKVNVTNQGLVTAWDVIVKLYIDGKEKGTKNIKSIEQDDFKELTFNWKASGPNDKLEIKVNVSLNNVTWEQIWDNNEKTRDLEVLEKQIIDPTCLAVIIIIVIIVVIVIIYFYRRRREEAEFLRRSSRGKSKGKGKDKGKKKKDKDKNKNKDKEKDKSEKK